MRLQSKTRRGSIHGERRASDDVPIKLDRTTHPLAEAR